MENAAKLRNPRNREWEKQRRNKFNEAIAKLGEVVKTVNRANKTATDEDNAPYPKIEIVQKAIFCLNFCLQERTQLKAEILALQVRLDGEKIKTNETKDVSTQVYIAVNKTKKNAKLMKIMLQKSKSDCKAQKPKVIPESKTTQNPQKLPTLLPKTNSSDKKGTENTIVVLPAAPYIFPQRPLLIPSVPPAFVLVDPNLHTLNKQQINRNNGDTTKTTMVNILPISAYSHPLSATKPKKSGVKLKNEGPKRVQKKQKSIEKSIKTSAFTNTSEKTDVEQGNKIANKETVKTSVQDVQGQKVLESTIDPDSQKVTTTDISTSITEDKVTKTLDNITSIDQKIVKSNPIDAASHVKNSEKIIVTNDKPKLETTTSDCTYAKDISIKVDDNKTNKLSQETLEVVKSKENKLPNILDSTLCDSAVDGGNARLELAEEFLAASPTAAFLMSFPLVSGNRADSPLEEQSTVQGNKDVHQRRNDISSQQNTYFDKSIQNDTKIKSNAKVGTPVLPHKPSDQEKCVINIVDKQSTSKTSSSAIVTNTSSENPFLSLPMPSVISTTCPLTDTTFGLDFDCNISKPLTSQSTNFVSTSNLFYKNDPFSTVKSTIYSTSSISSSHDFNNLSLYPCAMEKYSSKTKSDFPNVEDNLMKIGSSRLTYDIDLGWSHKSFDFVTCTTTSTTFTKDTILPSSSMSYSSSYNPFNPEFHVPLVSNSNRKESMTSKPSTFPDTIPSFYSQPTTLWPEEVPFYSNSNISKTSSTKHQNYITFDHNNTNTLVKTNITKQYEMKELPETGVSAVPKATNIGNVQHVPDKYVKKPQNKMHINWMTSEVSHRPVQTNCNPTQADIKDTQKTTLSNMTQKTPYNHIENVHKKHEHNESSYFPISMHNYPTQPSQEEFHTWPSTRPLGTAEVSIEPPPINLPTLVGDLALGPHDKKKTTDISTRVIPQGDVQNCGNFLSVTQLMNRSTDHMATRYQGINNEVSKSIPTKQIISNYTSDHSRKGTNSRMESNINEPFYVLNDPKVVNSYENMTQYSQNKSKSNSKPEKISKTQKHSYSAEALIRSGNCTQKIQDGNSAKFMMSSQKYNEFTPQESGVAQITHYPPILDYSDNSYVSQQFSATTLYNSTTNTISNSFYSNFMPGSSNLITSNYSTGHFAGDFIDYNQNSECNYPTNKYEELKMRNNLMPCQPEKTSNYKTSKRDSATKHKLECSKKESSKKYQSKRTKLNNEVDEWSDPNLLWQNKSTSKRHPNLMTEELPFPNYVGNQMPTQYQSDFFNSHLMPANMQNMSHNMDRSLSSFPVTSRANFNLSTIFPEITMKVQ